MFIYTLFIIVKNKNSLMALKSVMLWRKDYRKPWLIMCIKGMENKEIVLFTTLSLKNEPKLRNLNLVITSYHA